MIFSSPEVRYLGSHSARLPVRRSVRAPNSFAEARDRSSTPLVVLHMSDLIRHIALTLPEQSSKADP